MCGIVYVSVLSKLDLRNSRERYRIKAELPAFPAFAQKRLDPGLNSFESQQSTRLFLFLSELMDIFVAGRDQSAADQPNNLAEGHLPL